MSSAYCRSSPSTLIDHISSSDQLPVIPSYQAVGLSDHHMQGVDFGAPTCPQEVRIMWIHSFRKCDWDKLRETLSHAPWHVVSIFDDIDDQWDMFHFLLLDSLNAFASLHKVSSRKAKRPTPWFIECIAAKLKEKNYAKQIDVQSGGERDKKVYLQLKNKLKVIMCDAKTSYLRDALFG